MEDAPDIAVIIVSWNVRDLLCSCLLSVEEDLDGSRLAGEIFVVDNASHDGTPDTVRRRFPNVCLIANETNVGFAKANNLALRVARARYALLLNPDTRVRPGALRALVGYLDGHPKVGVVGPRLFYPDGREQSSRRRFPSFATALLESTPFQRFCPEHRLLRRYFVAELSSDTEQEVDWLIGACLIVRRDAWEAAGLLDEDYFMYSEELDWCRRIKRAGWHVVYLPQAEVVHYEAQSSEQNALARHQRFHDSRVRYFRKHHGRLPAFGVRLATVAGFAFMLVEETVKYVLAPRKRAWRRPRLAVMAAALAYHVQRLAG